MKAKSELIMNTKTLYDKKRNKTGDKSDAKNLKNQNILQFPNWKKCSVAL